MNKPYDAIIVGARCAGSPTAMLLARRGHRVLLVDRADFPSDTLSTHVVQPRAVAALGRWGLLDRLVATGCPPIGTYAFDFGPFTIAGTPGTAESPVAFCARRTILDKLLVDAAAEAGVEVREGFAVEGLVIEHGRVVGIKGRSKETGEVTERAAVVIGADGRKSLVAEAVAAPRYNERAPLLVSYYSYWSGLPMGGRFETTIRPHCGFAAAPTHDGLTMVVTGWPQTEVHAVRRDIDGSASKLFSLAPEFDARLRSAERESQWVGASTPNLFRKPFGPGWALVGDAGYLKDPITAQGINDAFRDAELCATALDRVFTGSMSFDEALGGYQRSRDEAAVPMFEFTCQLAALQPPPPELQQLLAAIQGNALAMDRFAQLNAGTLSPVEFFSQESVGQMMGTSTSTKQ